ncbi:MAG TPA: tetratricopeptide repeat protein [Candidatus Binatia bacterium]|nr:tetratricopeptide repeat protein [Candidatus Binatia bacterium]
MRRGRVTFAVLAVAALAGAVVGYRRLGPRLPLEEAHRFLTAPVAVGDAKPAPPAVPATPAEIDERMQRAEAAFAAGDYREAGDDFAWVVAQDPSGPHAGPAQWNLTRSRLRSGDATRALAAFEDLLAHDGAWLGEQAPSLRRGLDLLAKDDLGGAQAAFERMIREQPDSELVPVAHALVARIHWSRREPMETVRSFGRMFASVKDAPAGYTQLARSLERYANGDPAAAQRFGELADEGDADFRHLYQYLAARSLLEQDRFAAAHDSLERLRRRFPDGDFSHIVDLEHAWNLLRNGKAEEALALFRRLEATPAPANAAAFDEFFDLRDELPMGVARAELALRRYPEAVADFERALAANPRSIFAVENSLGLAAAYEGAGQLDRAAAVLSKVIAEHPDEPRLWALRQQLARIEERRTAAAHAAP